MTSDTITIASDRSALAAQGRQTTCGHGGGHIDIKGRGPTLVDVLVAAVVLRASEEVLEEDGEMALWFIATIAKSQAIQSISAPF